MSRFSKIMSYAAVMDADDKQKWITTETGSHILVDGDGNIVAGAGGKFNGKPLSSMGGTKKFTKYQTNEERKLNNNLQSNKQSDKLSPSSQNETSSKNGDSIMTNLKEINSSPSSSSWASKKAEEVSNMSESEFLAYKESLNVKKGIGPKISDEKKAENLAMTKDQAVEKLMNTHNNLLGLSESKKEEKPTTSGKSPIISKMEELGGKEWKSGGEHRIYFNNPADLAGVDFGSNNKNIKANSGKLYYNVNTNEWKWAGSSEFGKTIADAIRAKLT